MWTINNFHKVWKHNRPRKSDGENITVRISDRELQKRASRRVVLDGFPWVGEFKTEKEVQEYLHGDRIQCLLCGRSFKALVTHLLKIHNVSVDDYKIRYGLPWTRGLACSETSVKCSQSCIRRINSGELDLSKVAGHRKSFKTTQRPLHGYVKEKQQKSNPAGINALLEYSKKNKGINKYKDHDFDLILDIYETTRLGICEITEKNKELPSFFTFNVFRKQHPDFNKRYLELKEKLLSTKTERDPKTGRIMAKNRLDYCSVNKI